MFDFSLIKKDSIIITPLEVKQEIIKEKEKINPSFSIKILSKEDVIEGSYFKKSIEALWYLHQKGYSLASAEEIVSSLQGTPLLTIPPLEILYPNSFSVDL